VKKPNSNFESDFEVISKQQMKTVHNIGYSSDNPNDKVQMIFALEEGTKEHHIEVNTCNSQLDLNAEYFQNVRTTTNNVTNDKEKGKEEGEEDPWLPLTDPKGKTFYVKYKLNSENAGISILLFTPVCLISQVDHQLDYFYNKKQSPLS